MGEFSRDIDNITFLHGVVKILNEYEKSPFYRRIRMLGDIPLNIRPAERIKFSISQAFLIDYLINTISKDAMNSIHPPIFYYYYYKKPESQIELIRFIIKYFSAVKNIFPDEWEKPNEFILTKTIGIGALIRAMYLFFIKIFIDDYHSDFDEITHINTNTITSKLSGIEAINFSKTGPFGGIGGAGSLNKLKKEMIEKISLFETSDYDDFIQKFKQDYLSKFKEKNKKIL
jgi:hypothetical protein